MNRTQEQIVERVKTNDRRDPLGFALADLVEWLDFQHASQFLQPGVTAEIWNDREKPQPVREQMIAYMPFAWEKANGCRGISASRSMTHYAAWLWLIGEDELSNSLEHYDCYGKDNLVRICEFLGLDPKQWDDSRRVNTDSE